MTESRGRATSQATLDAAIENAPWRSPGRPDVAAAPDEGAQGATPDHGWLATKAKRAIDVVISALSIAVLAPIMLLIALAIRVDSRGAAIYRQPRVGRDGRVFEMLKFRTMEEGADDRRHELHHLNENDGILFKSRIDPRVTRVGRMLRPLSLDELPQLFQVLTGTMSLVGPRPMPPDMDVLIDDRLRQRLTVRPGVTGPWQIDRTERRRSIQEMAKMDCEYVREWSIWSDLRVLLSTVPYLLRRSGI